MPFQPNIKQEALVQSRRCCSICHRFVGRSIEIHHIKAEADGGANALENAVALCLECHSEVGHYNSRHPIGNKYSPEEVTRHRDNWWKWCSTNPHLPLPDEPVRLSPNEILLPRATEPISSGATVPIDLDVRNVSECDMYAIWIRILLSEAGLDESALLFDDAIGTLNLGPQHVAPDTGRVVLKFESKGGGLPNYNFKSTAVKVSTSIDGAVSYLGISRLRPAERRTFNLRFAPSGSMKLSTIPIHVASLKEEQESWLRQEDRSFTLDIAIPEHERFRRGAFRVSLTDIEYQKRD